MEVDRKSKFTESEATVSMAVLCSLFGGRGWSLFPRFYSFGDDPDFESDRREGKGAEK